MGDSVFFNCQNSLQKTVLVQANTNIVPNYS